MFLLPKFITAYNILTNRDLSNDLFNGVIVEFSALQLPLPVAQRQHGLPRQPLL
jgi:hypothetical protein